MKLVPTQENKKMLLSEEKGKETCVSEQRNDSYFIGKLATRFIGVKLCPLLKVKNAE